MELFIILFLLFIIVIVLVSMISGIYNGLVRSKNKIEESLSSVDVNLKLRYDLIPNLVSSVKGYAAHEKEIFTSLAKARQIFDASKSIEEKINVSNKAFDNMSKLIAVSEAYPELKSETLFISLMKSLNEVEEKISAARRYYNASINDYNNKVQTFPSNLIAKRFKFKKQEPFKIETKERENFTLKDLTNV